MVNIMNLGLIPLLALLGAALPTTSTDNAILARDNDVPFSFERWADAIAKGEPHISIDEALQAANTSSVAQALPDGKRSIEKRLRCNHLSRVDSAWAPDAVACINQLASNDRMCRIEASGTFCLIGDAMIFGVRGGSERFTESSCRDVARAAGFVMDNCWRADNRVQGDHFAWGNGNMAVHVSAPFTQD
ncbi:hypothetical protein F5X68DRAFT_247133 [Plectosphaerella plurivora]|uniref:Ecp2 effector protein domain-containing protein n=1 Tax=Plectosphaerella plurivora TaxID=936078 RepID=A0A9P9A7W8_9PEZI|nr:hypothetical protein F5X68DRAFT_247133 [Plectosphaerella plurivora]